MSHSEPDEEGLAVPAVLQRVLEGNKTLTVSTSANDLPWAAGGYFAEDGLFTVGMILETQGTTMSNIRTNPRIALSITSGTPFAQAQAQAQVETLPAP